MSQKSGLMQGKRGVILGVANNRTGVVFVYFSARHLALQFAEQGIA
jgi:hypothetical protein